MKSRSMFLIVGLVVLLATTASVWAQPPAGGGRGGNRGMMGNMMYLERAWTAVSFQLEGVTDAQEAALKPVFKQALDARVADIEAARQAGGDRQAMMQAMQAAGEKCKTTLDTALQQQLTPVQWDALQKLLAPPQRGNRGGGGG
jgi:hypothetical protein